MSTLELVVVTIALILLAAIVVVMVVAAILGRDIECFEAYRHLAPKQYRNLKKVMRVNGPMCSILCAGGLFAAPFAALDPDGGILAGVAMFVGFAIGLWLSVRWSFWAWKPY